MKTTEFVFFKNTPLTDFINTIHFESNTARDNFFLRGNHYETFPYLMQDYNFIRNRLSVQIYCDDVSQFLGVNYATFKSDFEDVRYYAFILSTTYLNDRVVQVQLMIDTVMTFTQGNVIEQFKNLTIKRQHLDNKTYKEFLPQLRTNSDILECTTKRYIHQKNERFLMNWVVFQSAVDLTKAWGDENNPKITTSTGGTFDKLTSPVNLYSCEYTQFPKLMEILKDVPWVAQNITKIFMLPFDFFDESQLKSVKVYKSDFQLKQFKDGGKSSDKLLNGIDYSINKLLSLFNLNAISEKHLFRSHYTTIELYSYDGQSILLDPAFLDDTTGLKLQAKTVLGYVNELRIFPLDYQTSESEETITQQDKPAIYKGTFLNNAFTFSNWTELPLLIDNYKLGIASNANQRQLAQDRLLTNRAKNVIDYSEPVTNENIEKKVYNGISVFSDVSIGALTGKLTDEYEYYRDLKAQQADMQLRTPTVTAQPSQNAFQVANDIFGFTLKVSGPTENEWEKIKTYYKVMGHQTEQFASQLAPIDSMQICNYVQFTGNYVIDGIPSEMLNMLKPLFENGVRLWHNNNTPNPMTQDISLNEPKF